MEMASREEVIENLSELQSELYMRLAECQRELDYAKSYGQEQETQYELRIKELEVQLQEVRKEQERRDQSLLTRLREAEKQVSEQTKNAQMWESRSFQSNEQIRLIESKFHLIESQSRDLLSKTNQLEREKESLLLDLRHYKNSQNNSDLLNNELRKVQQDLRFAQERLVSAEGVIRDLQGENQELRAEIRRKNEETRKENEAKINAEEKVLEMNVRLKDLENGVNRVVDQRVSEVESRVRDNYLAKVTDLERKIERLVSDKENLRLELQSRPSSKLVRDLQGKLSDLEGNMSRNQHHRRRTQSVTPLKDRRSGHSKSFEVGNHEHRKVLHEVMRELGEAHASGVLERVREMKQAKELVEKLGKLVVECSPAGTESPSVRRIWRWVRSVVEDLMKLQSNK